MYLYVELHCKYFSLLKIVFGEFLSLFLAPAGGSNPAEDYPNPAVQL